MQDTAPAVLTRTVTIPASREHQGLYTVTVTLLWECPRHGVPRGEPYQTVSYDGSRRVACDGWKNPCGCADYYEDIRREAGVRQGREPR